MPCGYPESVVPTERRRTPDRKRVAFFFVMVVLTAGVCGLGLWGGYRWYDRHCQAWPLTQTISVIPNQSLYRTDPVLGFACKEGAYTIEMSSGEDRELQPLTFRATIDADGARITQVDRGKPDDRPEIWILGCSFTWGWGVNDDETMPWLIQAAFPGYRVINMACPGYGTVHGMLQLDRAIHMGRRPAAVVMCYNSFHQERNVASTARLKEFHVYRDMTNMMHPRAYINDMGHLRVRTVLIQGSDDYRPDRDEMLQVTQMIFDRMVAQCRSHGIVPVIAFQSRWGYDPLMAYGKNQGWTMADVSVDFHDSRYNLLPHDGHPNAQAHRLYAERLAPVLARSLVDGQSGMIVQDTGESDVPASP